MTFFESGDGSFFAYGFMMASICSVSSRTSSLDKDSCRVTVDRNDMMFLSSVEALVDSRINRCICFKLATAALAARASYSSSTYSSGMRKFELVVW